MKKHSPKVWRLCGQHINASDDNCSDLKRHCFLESDIENCVHGVIAITCTKCKEVKL